MTGTVPDPIMQFAALRPTEQDLDRAWPADRREAVLERVRQELHSPTGETVTTATEAPARRVPRRRVVLAAVGVAAAVAALLTIPLVVPSGGPGGPPTAAALEQLAMTASAQPPLQPGQYWHTVTTQTTNGHTTTMHRWAAPDGHIWRFDTAGSTVMYYNFPPGQLTGSLLNPSPAFLAGLPTDPAALNTYLRAHADGGTSRNEAVFFAVYDMLSGGLAPPALRAAALRVLERTDHITAQAGHDSTGRPAVVVTFVDQATRPDAMQRLYFAPDTARIIERTSSWPGNDYTGTVTTSGIAATVPAEILKLGTSTGTCVTSQGQQPTRALCDSALAAGAEQGLATPASAPPTR